MELKYLDYDFIQEITVGFNRTFMELKCRIRSYWSIWSEVLIVPLWN